MVMTLVGATFLACSDPSLVFQRREVQYNATEKTVVVRDEQAPNQGLTLQVSSAEMLTEPKVGEIVRIAYCQTSRGLVGIRVMNLSHQIKRPISLNTGEDPFHPEIKQSGVLFNLLSCV